MISIVHLCAVLQFIYAEIDFIYNKWGVFNSHSILRMQMIVFLICHNLNWSPVSHWNYFNSQNCGLERALAGWWWIQYSFPNPLSGREGGEKDICYHCDHRSCNPTKEACSGLFICSYYSGHFHHLLIVLRPGVRSKHTVFLSVIMAQLVPGCFWSWLVIQAAISRSVVWC